MQWEYATLEIAAKAHPTQGAPVVGSHPLDARLNRLGREGWEICSSVLCEDPARALLILKRVADFAPVPDAPAKRARASAGCAARF